MQNLPFNGIIDLLDKVMQIQEAHKKNIELTCQRLSANNIPYDVVGDMVVVDRATAKNFDYSFIVTENKNEIYRKLNITDK